MKIHRGQVVDVIRGRIFPGEITVEEGKIKAVNDFSSSENIISDKDEEFGQFILPGFIDAHVHVESSMLIPSEFARLSVAHGTVATISDPHEIANVLGIEGVKYMIENGKKVPFKFYFGAPSCVPATKFETAGAEIGSDGIRELLQMPEIRYLAEMMNYPGVLNGEKEVLAKINIAHELGKVVDGHAPGLRGELARQYIAAGISTDHECFTAEEAIDKLKWGMKILIREGSAAKNFDALIDLMPDHHENMMFCSDDKHPNDLVEGHLNLIAARAVAKGIDPMKVIRALSLNVVRHYGLEVGLLQKGDPADFIIVENLENFRVKETWIDGQLVAKNGKSLIHHVKEAVINQFGAGEISAENLKVFAEKQTHRAKIRVITVEDGQLITGMEIVEIELRDSQPESEISGSQKPTPFVEIKSDPGQDLLKLVVVNRYFDAPPSVAFVRNFGLKKGAIASSVAHDSHNVIAVGVSDEDIADAINAVIREKGGVSLSCGAEQSVLALPVAGLMSTADGYAVAKAYQSLDKRSKELGSGLRSPYMTLSFCALLVIPRLKLSDKGLFDGEKFEFVGLSF